MIDWNFSIGRSGLLVGLLAVFWFLGGFEFPVPSENSTFDPSRLSKAWMATVLLFVAGAISASLIDHWAGNVEPSNIRSAYIVLGVLLMGGGLLWQNSLRAALS